MHLGRVLMGVVYVVAGAGHFVATGLYMRMVPDTLPAHRELVLLSGAAEIAGGVGVLVSSTRRAASWGIIALLIAVFPANVAMLQHPGRWPRIPLWALWLRLPLQLPLMAWAYRYTRTD